MAVGTVEPRYKTNLGFRVLGRLIARPVNVGDLVGEGQTVAAIDPTALELAVRSAKAELSKAQAQLANAIGTEERKRTLIKTDATTKQTLDDAEQVRAGRTSIGRSRPREPDQGDRAAGLCPGQGRFRRCRHGRERRGGTSRLAGSERRDRGATGRQGGCGRYRRGLSRCRLTVGLPFTVSLQLLPAVQVEGQIREIAPQADHVTRMRRVRIALNDPPESFRLGSTVTARLSNGHSSVLASARVRRALKEGAETFVWVIDLPTSTVSLHKVDLSEDEGGIRVTGGLSIGARIVTAGIHSLKQGQQVRIEQDATP